MNRNTWICTLKTAMKLYRVKNKTITLFSVISIDIHTSHRILVVCRFYNDMFTIFFTVLTLAQLKCFDLQLCEWFLAVAIVGCSWYFDKVKNPITFQNNREKLKFMENQEYLRNTTVQQD